MAARVCIAFLIISVLSYGYCSQPSAISMDQEYQTELENRLRILNKPPVKTIITKEAGEVFDCIRINEQPAFDHPALKNHKIQLHPTISPLSRKSSSEMRKTSVRFRGTREACPDGTVPIKRTTKEDLIWSDKQLDQEASSKKANVRLENQGKLLGSYYNIALYNLSIADDQESSSEMRLETSPPGQADVLSVGWKVSHNLNGDGFTRLFGYWHDGTNNKGCYNTLCPGFIQVDKEVSINFMLPPPLSTYGDTTQQYGAFFSLSKDQDTGNWMLYGGEERVYIGYWPKELFPNLVNGADLITWGGSTSPGANGGYPPMGNGHFPDGFYKDTCFFDSVRYISSANELVVPRRSDTTTTVDSPNCYDLKVVEPNETLEISAFSFIFGGPGGKCS